MNVKKIFDSIFIPPLFELAISIALLILLSIGVASMAGYNSDSIQSYSQGKDILQYGSLQGWTFSATAFFFPDILFALPLAYFFDQPFLFYLFASPLQIILFVTLISIYAKHKSTSEITKFYLACAVSSALLFLGGSAFFGKPYFFMAQTFFLLSHHGFAAITALLLFLLYDCNINKKSLVAHIAIFIVFVLATISDFYFALYFLALMVTLYNKQNLVLYLSHLIGYGLVSILIFLISYQLNPSLALQAHNSLNIMGYDRLEVFARVCLLLSPLLMATIYLQRINKMHEVLWRILVAVLVVTFALLIFGLIKNQYHFRYVNIIYMASIIFCAYVLIHVPRSVQIAATALAFIGTLSLIAYSNFYKEPRLASLYENEIKCIQNDNQYGSTIVADYWPAKIIFESLGRQYNLFQVNENLHERNWVYNTRWRKIHPENGNYYIVKHLLNDKALQKLKEGYAVSTICDGEILKLTGDAPPEFYISNR